MLDLCFHYGALAFLQLIARPAQLQERLHSVENSAATPARVTHPKRTARVTMS